jgi:hypothetical protein
MIYVLVDNRAKPVHRLWPIRAFSSDLLQADTFVETTGNMLSLNNIEELRASQSFSENDANGYILPARSDDAVTVGQIDIATRNNLTEHYVS